MDKTASNSIERMAVKRGWPISDEAKQDIVDRQIEIATSDEVSARASTSAARVLVQMESQNIALATGRLGLDEERLEPVPVLDLLRMMHERTCPSQ